MDAPAFNLAAAIEELRSPASTKERLHFLLADLSRQEFDSASPAEKVALAKALRKVS